MTKETTFKNWRLLMGLTRKEAASKLDLSVSQIRKYDTAEVINGYPQNPGLFLRYAMRSIANNADPWPE